MSKASHFSEASIAMSVATGKRGGRQASGKHMKATQEEVNQKSLNSTVMSDTSNKMSGSTEVAAPTATTFEMVLPPSMDSCAVPQELTLGERMGSSSKQTSPQSSKKRKL